MDFSNKVVIVTGSSSGIGAETAVQFAAKGASLTITGRDQRRLDITRQKCLAVGATEEKVLALTGDVTIEGDIKQIVAATVEKFDKIDVLINNAGTVTLGYICDITENDILKDYQSNTVSMFNFIKASLPHLLKTKGNVVNVSSVAGSTACPAVLSYAMAKAAVNQLTQCLALQYACQGVRFNTVSVAYTDTPIFRTCGLCDDTQEAHQKFLDDISMILPMQRIGKPAEVANAIMYMASDMASFSTGTTMCADGGLQIGNNGNLDVDKVKSLKY